MNSKLGIVIPTFNEKNNISRLIENITNNYEEIVIIIVDDNSPDGTSKIVKSLMHSNDKLYLITRFDERGRGSAVIEGFNKALDLDCDLITEMDADFSHHPREIKDMLEKIQICDMVIGSRYLPSSKIIGWPWHRKLFSKIANIFARALLGIIITDYTNGFRMYRRNTIKSLNFNKINLSGYIVLSEIALQVFNNGFEIQEIPTIFVNRQRGESNLSIKEIWSAFSGIIKLWYRNNSSYFSK